MPSDTSLYATGDVTGDATEQAAAHVAGDDSVAKLNVRVRGRWTAQQKAFIEQLAAEQGATAGEVVRFIIAWYLAQEDRPRQPANRQSLVPSADMLVKRETGMKIFDFLTTSGQAASIKRAAGAAGEAAFMRRALEEFKVHGPLNTKN